MTPLTRLLAGQAPSVPKSSLKSRVVSCAPDEFGISQDGLVTMTPAGPGSSSASRSAEWVSGGQTSSRSLGGRMYNLCFLQKLDHDFSRMLQLLHTRKRKKLVTWISRSNI